MGFRKLLRLGIKLTMADSINKLFLRCHAWGCVSPLIRYSKKLRREILNGVHLNTDLITNRLTAVDLITDSLKERVIHRKYFSSASFLESAFLRLQETFQRYFGYPYVLPVSQGRQAEFFLAHTLIPTSPDRTFYIPNNLLFITTRFNQTSCGAQLIEIPVAEAYDLTDPFPFKGNLDTTKLQQIIQQYGPAAIPYIMVETSANASGGHPVSMANIRAVYQIAQQHHIPLFIDACRLIENAWLIQKREPGYGGKTIAQIIQEFCSYTDGCTMSATKDYYLDTGGFIAAKDKNLYRRLLEICMLAGDGLSVRAKGELTLGLEDSFKNVHWFMDRIQCVQDLADWLVQEKIPVVQPFSGHAVFIDARPLCEFIKKEHFPIKSFLAHLYLESGILGSENHLTPSQEERGVLMLRLAIPLRSFNAAQISYTRHHLVKAWNTRRDISGVVLKNSPQSLSERFLAEYIWASSKS